MKIHFAAAERDAQLWEQFVESHPECSNYHRWGWKRVIEDSFGWPTFYLMAMKDESIHGILPLVWQKSWMFGNFLTSLPFLNCGGVVADSQDAKEALVTGAIALAQRLRAKHLELRHRSNPELALPIKTHKVTVVRSVEPDVEKMWVTLPRKARTHIRKAIKFSLTADFGGEELLDEFYEVFARNMRDLGTPVYSRLFFSEIVKVFPRDTYICVVRHQGKPIATSFLTGYRGTLEAVWSSSLYHYISMKPNMFLYWKILCFAGERGYQVFDFGRSTVGSGTHTFKRQWGSQDVPLYWTYWVPDGADLPELNIDNPRFRLAIWLWQKLPVSLTKLVGPTIVKCLP